MPDKFVEKIGNLTAEIDRYEAEIAGLQRQISGLQGRVWELQHQIDDTREQARKSIGLEPHPLNDEQMVAEMQHYYGTAAVLRAAEMIEGDDARV